MSDTLSRMAVTARVARPGIWFAGSARTARGWLQWMCSPTPRSRPAESGPPWSRPRRSLSRRRQAGQWGHPFLRVLGVGVVAAPLGGPVAHQLTGPGLASPGSSRRLPVRSALEKNPLPSTRAGALSQKAANVAAASLAPVGSPPRTRAVSVSSAQVGKTSARTAKARVRGHRSTAPGGTSGRGCFPVAHVALVFGGVRLQVIGGDGLAELVIVVPVLPPPIARPPPARLDLEGVPGLVHIEQSQRRRAAGLFGRDSQQPSRADIGAFEP